jgi:GNAT superfamily N-acetyltransferase
MTATATAIRSRTSNVRVASDLDRAQLRRFLADLSPASILTRFHGTGFHPSEEMLDLLLCRSLPGRALVVEDDGEIVGHAQWCASPGRPDVAEISIVVADAWHGYGIGTRLARAAIADARAHGVEVVVAPVLDGDRAARRLVRRVLPGAARQVFGEVVDYQARVA